MYTYSTSAAEPPWTSLTRNSPSSSGGVLTATRGGPWWGWSRTWKWTRRPSGGEKTTPRTKRLIGITTGGCVATPRPSLSSCPRFPRLWWWWGSSPIRGTSGGRNCGPQAGDAVPEDDARLLPLSLKNPARHHGRGRIHRMNNCFYFSLNDLWLI